MEETKSFPMWFFPHRIQAINSRKNVGDIPTNQREKFSNPEDQQHKQLKDLSEKVTY